MIAMRRCYAISIIGMEGKNMNHNKKKILKVTALFVFMFFLGWGAGSLQKQQMKKTVETVSVQNQADNWGLGFGAEGTQPTGNVTADELKKYNAWYVGDKSKNVIYLTFDCGYENGNTEPILDALKKHNAKATFFVVGHFLESAPDIVKRMEAEGHAVGNHTYHHANLTKADDDTIEKEISDVNRAVKNATGEKATLIRPPYGAYNDKVMALLTEPVVLWDLDTEDWSSRNAQDIAEKVLSTVKDGDIVLMHDIYESTAEAVEIMVPKLKEMGYQIVSVSQMAQYKGRTLELGKAYGEIDALSGQ